MELLLCCEVSHRVHIAHGLGSDRRYPYRHPKWCIPGLRTTRRDSPRCSPTPLRNHVSQVGQRCLPDPFFRCFLICQSPMLPIVPTTPVRYKLPCVPCPACQENDGDKECQSKTGRRPVH